MANDNVNTAEIEGSYFGEALYGKGKQFFDDPVLDQMLEAFMELAAEVWVERDRGLITEAVLNDFLMEKHGVNLTQLIEQYEPSKELEERRLKAREAFATSVFNSFSRHLDPKNPDKEQG